jgi:hypothetical protein
MRIGTESRQQARRKDPRGCTNDECPEDIVGTAGSGFKDVLKSRNHELVVADVQEAVMVRWVCRLSGRGTQNTRRRNLGNSREHSWCQEMKRLCSRRWFCTHVPSVLTCIVRIMDAVSCL